MTAVIETRGLTKRYGRVTALRSVDLSIATGECVALFGRNGAGKTTLIQIVGSLLAHYDGEAELFGQRHPGHDGIDATHCRFESEPKGSHDGTLPRRRARVPR